MTDREIVRNRYIQTAVMYKLQKGNNIRVAIFAKYKGRELSIRGGGYIQKEEKDRLTMHDRLTVSERNTETDAKRQLEKQI